MESAKYFELTKKREHKNKPRNTPLPKAKQNYLEAFENFEQTLRVFEIKYETLFQFNSTKHWRFDFHLIEYRILVEIAGGPWSGGRKGKLSNKAWSLEKYDQAWQKGYTVIRIESAARYKINESGPTQIDACNADNFLRRLKRQKFNEPDPTIPAD